MHAVTELLKPSVVTQTLIMSTHEGDLLLVIRGKSLLQVYTDIHNSAGPKWLAEFPLQGAVTSMTSVATNVVVLTLLQAKMVVLQWDFANLVFNTTSLHFYEKVKDRSSFDTASFRKHHVSVDHRNKCLTFWFQNEYAAFVRFQDSIDPLKSRLTDYVKTTSSVFRIQDLILGLGVASVVDFAHLEAYREPTLAVIAWSKATWAGLVGADGAQSKDLIITSVKPEGFKRLVHIPKISYEIQRVYSLNGVPDRLALLVALETLYVLDEGRVLHSVECDAPWLRLENSTVCQLPNSPFVVVSCESGKTVVVDTVELRATISPELSAVGSVTCCASPEQFVISSRVHNTKLMNWSFNRTKDSMQPIGTTLKDLYSQLSTPTAESPTVQFTAGGELESYGSLSSITSIDNGLACSTNDSVLIVEREMPFDELSSVPMDFDLTPGRFWVVSGESKPVILSSYEEESEGIQYDEDTPKKKRRQNEPTEHTQFSELATGADYDQPVTTTKACPRGLGANQLTLAVYEMKESVVVVQSRQIAKFEPQTWKLQQKISISHSHRAEIQGKHVLVQGENDCKVYSLENLEVYKHIEQVDLATLSSQLLVAVKDGVLELTELGTNTQHTYDISNLDRLCPQSGGGSGGGAAAAAGVQVTAVYALEFSGTQYIGIHMGRTFTIYQLHGTNLVKQYSVPFSVNQSPIYEPEHELLFFLGSKSHVVVKGRQSGFNCHRLQLYGDHMIDVTQHRSNPDSSCEIVWLDSRQTLHFVQLDSGLDLHSNSMPLRQIKLDVPGVSIKSIDYHEEFASVIVGANVSTPYTGDEDEPPAGDDEEPEMAVDLDEEANGGGEEEGGEGEEKAANDDEQQQMEDAPELESDTDDGVTPETFKGRVYVLPLTNYKFQPEPILKLEEALLNLKLVDLAESSSVQMLAIGTARCTLENQETNGHVRVYKVREDQANSDAESSPPIVIDIYAEKLVRGSVSSLCEVMGYLAVAHGQQIHIYDYRKDLEPIGFYDTQIYMKDLKALRNILVLGERLRGPRLVNFALQPHRLDLLSSTDYLGPKGGGDTATAMVTTAVETISSTERGDLTVVHTTGDGRIQLFQYDPENPASSGGPHLVPLASCFTGRECTSMVAAQLYVGEDIVAYGTTSDGVVFCVKTLSEETFRTLFVLTQQMMDKEAADAGLNPRMHRATLSGIQSHSAQLLDINYAQRFWHLPLNKQKEYARKLGFEGLARVQRALNTEGRDPLKL